MQFLKFGFVLIIALSISNIAISGVVKEVTGKVDVLIDGKWQPAEIGMEMIANTKIMTGVSSSLTVEVKGGFFTVKELSMVTYSDKSTSDSVDHQVNIELGKAKVRFAKIEGVKSSFKVQTPKGTASVRGTEEDVGYYPVGGMSVDVVEGSIDVIDNSGGSFVAGQGEQAGVSGSGEIYGQSDIVQDETGYGSQFTDNDTQSNVVQDLADEAGQNENKTKTETGETDLEKI